MKIVILERNSVGTDTPVDIYEKFGEVELYPNTLKADVAERIKDADIVVTNKAPLNEETMKDAKNVKFITMFSTGYDAVDVEYCKKRGIPVANVRDYCTSSVAQHTFTMALWLLEHMTHYDNYVKSGEYSAQDRFSNFDIPFAEVEGKTWGIVGMGNIGRRVAKIASSFGAKVIFYSASGSSTCTEYERVDFDTLLKESDILSLHCPLSDKTRNLIDAAALAKMKKTSVLINVARGPVVNNSDLYDALVSGQIMAAGLDVVEKEPLAIDNPLSKIKDTNKLIITPHLAWASTEARKRCVDEVAANIEAYLEGRERNLVN
ncbi:MAG: D-2-hydroxyacid dehydrogenase [Lachnospiraceae bacterium]|nr:D-2-hydroxyacid dehydrogenase [Candidatus Merdinaster equi]